MQYLIRLIAPKGATVLDLFMGSGSTGKAAMIENVEREANYHFIGIDRTEEYLPIAQARIEFGRNYAEEKPKADGVVHKNQIDLFSLL
jgi:site-specific DNA-methyltransferase (adenine-specific)